jgi:excisionase family DNA binding protein
MKQIIFPTDPEEFIELILSGVDKKLVEFLKTINTNQPDELLTRQETCDLLKISLATLWAWKRKGKINSYSIGNRVYFKRNEIENALIKTN